jgi:isoleucyl-tRNA synthetase
MVSGTPAFNRVISNGLVLDKNGNKMSKRLGNGVDPFKELDIFGPDVLRWYMLTNSQPWDNLRFNDGLPDENGNPAKEGGVDEIRRKFFGTLYDTYSFFALYANVDGFDPSSPKVPYSSRPEIDRWIISLLNTLIKDVKAAYEDYDVTSAGRMIQDFVCDQVSNWYVRLNRKRFWGGEMNEGKLAAYQTLHEVLKTVAILSAPIAPFYMDQLYLDLVWDGEESVHYVLMPSYDPTVVDSDLEQRMALAQKASSMVLALRKKSGIIVRQPLSKVMIPVISEKVRAQIEGVKDLILGEVNVKEMEFISDTAGFITKKIKPNFKTLGKTYGKQMKEIAGAFNTLSQETITLIQNAETEGKAFVLPLPSGDVVLSPGDYMISTEDMPGLLVASEGSLTVVLDIELTEELRREGTARELINRIQNLRKDSDFDVTDRVDTVIYADGKVGEEITASLSSFADYVSSQTLSKTLRLLPMDQAPENAAAVEFSQTTIKIQVSKCR